MKSLIIIPARMESERLPGKPLLDVGGKSLLEWTYDRAIKADVDGVLIATSDAVIYDYCGRKGMGVMMTCKEHPTGTHRCAETAARLPDRYDVVINWQVDEPLVKSKDVERLMKLICAYNDISTLVAPLSYKDRRNRDVVKTAVSDRISHDVCQWFSRAPLAGAMGHVGVYAFRWEVLQKLGRLDTTLLSRAESLEQLTWLEDAWEIRAVETDKLPLSINTQEDLERFKEIVDAQVN